MLLFPESRVKKFVHRNKALRYGQAFYAYMKLHKVVNPQDKYFCDRLYNETDDKKAKNMIASRTQRGV